MINVIEMNENKNWHSIEYLNSFHVGNRSQNMNHDIPIWMEINNSLSKAWDYEEKLIGISSDRMP